MIQIVGSSNKRYNQSIKDNTCLTSLNAPKSFDEFDINIIDLQHESIWYNDENSSKSINIINHFLSIGAIINNSKLSSIIICLPQNYKMTYFYDRAQKKYYYSIELKDMLGPLKDILSKITTVSCELIYENTQTIIGDIICSADFYFPTYLESITVSKRSNKCTTKLINDRIFVTTLDILSDFNTIQKYLGGIGLVKCIEEYPSWLYEYYAFDDEFQNKQIKSERAKIEQSNRIINSAELKLSENLKYKSILFINSDTLVDVVYDILQQVLVCDLACFSDIKKEDFLIKKKDITFIGEIKGVNSNVKFEHITQVEKHYQLYRDKLNDSGIVENVKQLLIINPFRTKPINDREPIHKDQIQLATRNNCLIIETTTLLKLFEKFKKGDIGSDEIIYILGNKIGLLSNSEI